MFDVYVKQILKTWNLIFLKYLYKNQKICISYFYVLTKSNNINNNNNNIRLIKQN